MRVVEVFWVAIPPAKEGPSMCSRDTGSQEGQASFRWGSKVPLFYSRVFPFEHGRALLLPLGNLCLYQAIPW